MKAATGNLKDLAVGAITVARVFAAGLGDVIDDIILAFLGDLAVILCAICVIVVL